MRWMTLHAVTFAAGLVIATGTWPKVEAFVQGQDGANAKDEAPKTAELSELWIEPQPGRDLYYGVGGKALMPLPTSRFEILSVKKGGFSDGYTLKDSRGKQWSAKLYPEARTEVVASRLLWGLGYHQPPIYTLEEWWADGGAKRENPQPVARFREENPSLHGLKEEGSWSYSDNPFVGSKPLNGLLVLNVMLANADIKAANNMRYTLTERFEGATRWWVARDLGQSFGRTGLLSATRDDIESFERTRFITGIDGDYVQFEYYGPNVGLMKSLTTDDVRWICLRLSKLTDKQWLDAFRAGGYADNTAQRFIQQMKSKIAEGLAAGE